MAEAELGQLNLQEPPPSYATRSVDCFQKLDLIGQGTYGQVYRAKEIKTGDIVALKKIRTENSKEGFPISAVREIKTLTKLHHDNVIRLKEVVTSEDTDHEQAAGGKKNLDKSKYNGSVYLVFEYMDHDLTGLSERPGQRFSVPQIKCYMKQLLTGLDYCHTNGVLHRDIKGANLLLNNNGSLKLGDFGLACSFSNKQKLSHTNRVITLPYRPPELLLGATKYGPAVDIWSAGCVFGELLHGKPIMYGRSEPEQLHKLFELCGSPDEIIWPGVSNLAWYNTYKPARPKRRRLREVFRYFDPGALDLLDRMLTLDPCKRISAKEALDADYFCSEPLPCDPKCLPKYESSHEHQTKQRRRQQRLKEETARKQGLPHPPPFFRLPPVQHGGKVSQKHRHESNHSVNQGPRASNTFHNPHVDIRVNRHPSNGNLTGGYNQTHAAQANVSTGHYPSQGRADAYAGSSTQLNSYADAPPGFAQRVPIRTANNRNQHHGWQQ